jgi:tetratricopeptide (TPR) repeat protein
VFAEQADGEVVDRAVAAASSLEGLGRCEDRDALWNAIPLPKEEEERARVLAVEVDLDAVAALYRTGKHEAGLERATAQLAAADAAGHLPTRARALWLAGNLQREADNLEEAERTLRSAVQVAAQAKDDALVAEVWLNVLGVLAEQGNQDEALVLRATVDAAVARAGNDSAQRARLLDLLAAIRRATGEQDRAEEHLREALALRKQTFGEQHVEVGGAMYRLGELLLERGKREEARAQFEGALAVRSQILGESHRLVAEARAALARAAGE